jgi:histidinol-phosphatase
MKDDKLIIGVSCAPLLNETLYAEKGKGAFLNGRPIRVSETNDVSNSFITYGGVRQFVEKGFIDNLRELIKDAGRDRGFGDMYLYHCLASGKSDAVFEAAVNIWDIAALAVIVEEAGGKVTDLEGKPISKESKHIIATNRRLHEDLLKYFREE